MTRKLPLEVKLNRKPTRVACTFCHSKHLQCDSERPCKNCTKRGFADTCIDAVRKRKLSSKSNNRNNKNNKNGLNKDNNGIITSNNDDTSSSNKSSSSSGSEKDEFDVINDSSTGLNITNNNKFIGRDSSTIGGDSQSSTVTALTNNPEVKLNENSDKPISNKLSNQSSNVSRTSTTSTKSTTGRKRGRPPKIKNEVKNEVKTKKVKTDGINDTINTNEHTSLHGVGVVVPSSLNLLPPLSNTNPISNTTNSNTPTTNHQPLLNLANVSLSGLNLTQLNNLPSSSSTNYGINDLQLPSFTDLKNQNIFHGLQEIRTPQFDAVANANNKFSFSPNIGSTSISNFNGLPSLSNSKLLNEKLPTSLKPIKFQKESSDDITNTVKNNNNNTIQDNRIDNDTDIDSTNKKSDNGPIRLSSIMPPMDSDRDPETPGSPLEFSVTNSTKTNTIERNSIHNSIPLNKTRSNNDSKFNSHESSNGSVKNFESAVANDEYVQLTDILNLNPNNKKIVNNLFDMNINVNMNPNVNMNMNLNMGTNFNMNMYSDNSNNNSTNNTVNNLQINLDDGEDTRPYIIINLEDGSMISSYENNTTPNSYVYNADHSNMINTAKELPMDLQQDDDYTSPLIMRHVVKQPDDIYLTNIVKAYQYPKAYHALIAYLKKRFNKLQLLEIAKCMAKYRPSFISATKNLYENDLIFTERSFQRTLLEYENLISISPSPTIIWRRTGEIVALTNEFAVMTGYSKMSLLSKRTFIVELMDDESTINYFRSFSNFAFGDLNATYLTDCNLRKAEDNNYLKCCCVWTIKRDVFDIPMLIVGQFLPVLE
ncbi:Gsm1 protein [Pichia kluyveri]|uniref:Glucose starvation modulator protein 1 n=1 Tax=Pichia kluyveri TaxID=36015 RepID=A0AAV5R869_PICKL|nr:Gsm1 protein [Pichia kluyveri]